MAKLRLLAWVVLVGAAGWWLLTGLSWTVDDPAAQVMAVVRALAGGLAAYLFVVTLLAIRVPRVAPRFVRQLVAGAVGSLLLAAPMTASASTDDRPAAVDAPVLRRVDEPAPAFSAAPHPDEGVKPAENATEVTIGSGEHLWLVAEREVAGRLGRPPSDAEVVPFWSALIEANRATLASGDPDLVFPGETVVLPS